MNLISKVASAVSILITIAACSSSSTSTPTGGSDCVSALKGYCARFSECAPALFKVGYGDTATCETRLGLSCANYTAPGAQVTSDQWSACSSAFSALSCPNIASTPSACNFTGTLAIDATCGDDAQCSSGACSNDNNTCGKCVTAVAENGDCSGGKQCALGLSCSNDVCVKTGSNLGQLGAGASCDGKTPATSCNLYQGLVCIPSAGSTATTCQAVKFATVGQSCGFADGAYTVCEHSSCLGETGSQKCVAYLADNAACGVTVQGSCAPGANCIDSKCTVRNATTCK